jgi:tRNA pseudouridine38-40 synthase
LIAPFSSLAFVFFRCHVDITRKARNDPTTPAVQTHDTATVQKAMNHFLRWKKRPITVTKVEAVEPSFHARFSARERTYVYRLAAPTSLAYADQQQEMSAVSPVYCPKTDLLFEKERILVLPNPLDLGAMKAAAHHIVGTHDFSAVRAAGCAAKSPITTVAEATIELDPHPGFFMSPLSSTTTVGRYDFISVKIRARSFLYRMIRNLMGIFLEIGTGRQRATFMRDVIQSAARPTSKNMQYTTAPAHGLYLVDVGYTDLDEYKKCDAGKT